MHQGIFWNHRLVGLHSIYWIRIYRGRGIQSGLGTSSSTLTMPLSKYQGQLQLITCTWPCFFSLSTIRPLWLSNICWVLPILFFWGIKDRTLSQETTHAFEFSEVLLHSSLMSNTRSLKKKKKMTFPSGETRYFSVSSYFLFSWIVALNTLLNV